MAEQGHGGIGAGEVWSEIERVIDSEIARREIVDRILRWYIVTVSQAGVLLSPGDTFPVNVSPPDDPDPAAFDNPAAAFEWFDLERPNLVANARAALDAGLPRRAWELAMALSPIHIQHFAFDDWSVMSELAVTAAEELADQAALATALDNRGKFFFRRRALAEARATHAQALGIREAIGDQRGICESLNALGLIGLRTRELAEASAYFANTVDQARQIEDLRWESLGRMNLAEAHLEADDAAVALEVIRPLPQVFAQQNDPACEGNALWLLSWAERLAGNTAAALRAIDAALRIAENASNRVWEGAWLIEAARVHLAAGETDEAMQCCRMAASLERQIGDHSREATALDCTGEVLLAAGNAADAAAFHRQAARMHHQLGDNWQAAVATMHLANCEQALGRDDASREQVVAALSLLQPFSDDRAVQLRVDLEARLG